MRLFLEIFKSQAKTRSGPSSSRSHQKSSTAETLTQKGISAHKRGNLAKEILPDKTLADVDTLSALKPVGCKPWAQGRVTTRLTFLTFRPRTKGQTAFQKINPPTPGTRIPGYF
jgi:hypothetical protein